jgi:aspartyl-tRNA(Asn)/glutamyl-tRNA(Gln) amidotransferase subunit C
MKLTAKQVKHIAELARLGLTEKERKKFQKELSAIFDFVEKLNEKNTEKVEPTSHITGLMNVTREDAAKEGNEAQRKKILGLAPDTQDGYVKVKSIL